MIAARRWLLANRSVPLDRPLIMGVVNVTPDSFSDGGRLADPGKALQFARDLMADGADLIDIGGESSRPGAAAVTAEEEAGRILPLIESLAGEAVISVDTSKAAVAAAALSAGAEVINDITGGSDPAMLDLAASTGAGLILMHMQGDPRTMQIDPQYDDVVAEVTSYLADRAAVAVATGVAPEGISLDPGIGFGKTVDHNLALIRNLDSLANLGFPLVIGLSRKAFLGRITGIDDPEQRDLASSVAAALAVERGADILRVHNVAACREAVAVALAIVRGSGG